MPNDSRCKRCKWSIVLGSNAKKGYCACFYVVKAGNGVRPCPPNTQCTVFVERTAEDDEADLEL